MAEELRKNVYARFAREANKAGIHWIVLHGIDGFPRSIGRDLDVTSKGKADKASLLKTFEACLRWFDFRWIVYPSPIWGQRILGITEDFHVVELHVIDRLRVTNVSLKPDWEAVQYVEGLFPVERSASFFKGCLMPALATDAAWQGKCKSSPTPESFPWWLAPAAEQAKAGNEITILAKAILCGGYLVCHPLRSSANIMRWVWTKLAAPFQPTSPVYRVPTWMEPGAFARLVEEQLGELFLDVVCGDKLMPLTTRRQQSRQRMVYLTDTDVKHTQVIDLGSEFMDDDQLLNRILISFCEYNERWKEKYRSGAG